MTLEKTINLYTTLIQAIDPKTGRLELFNGPIVPGMTRMEAQEYCYKNGLAYCIVDKVFVKVKDNIYNNLN